MPCLAFYTPYMCALTQAIGKAWHGFLSLFFFCFFSFIGFLSKDAAKVRVYIETTAKFNSTFLLVLAVSFSFLAMARLLFIKNLTLTLAQFKKM